MEDIKQLQELSIEELKEKALLYGIKFPGNISKDKLIDKIDTVASATPPQAVGTQILDSDDDELYGDGKFNSSLPTRGEVREAKKQALMMLKVRITNLNSEEIEQQLIYSGVVTNYFTAARYIPVDTEWLVEQCLVDKLMTEKFQTFVNEIDPKTRRPTGNKVAKLTKHYNVQLLK